MISISKDKGFLETSHFWFTAFCLLFLISVWSGIILESVFLFIVPFAFIFAYLCLVNPKLIFYFFFLILPFSVEVELPGGFGTDLPSEPIMIIIMGLFAIIMLLLPKNSNYSLIAQPISFILIIHLLWIGFSSIFAMNKLFAFKYLLAKIWYVIPFYFFPLLLIKEQIEFRKILKLFLIGLLISVTYVMIQHATNGFSFAGINNSVKPIYRNHVNYAAILALSMPYLWYLFKSSNSQFHKKLYVLLSLFMFVAIYLTYTRAAYIVVLACFVGYFMIKFRLTLLAILLSIIMAIAYLGYNVYQSNYLELAPNYERTVAHYKFDNLVAATYKMEDISTMERLYRWVAGFQMFQEKPITGFGPSNFYSNYKDYSVSSFQTYVSDNPEKSGIHNNYLMVLVEQGIPGLLIMLLLAFVPLLIGQKTYHCLRASDAKYLLMAAILSFLAIDIFIIINDLLEADKIGPFFFLNAAIITYFGIEVNKQSSKDKLENF